MSAAAPNPEAVVVAPAASVEVEPPSERELAKAEESRTQAILESRVRQIEAMLLEAFEKEVLVYDEAEEGALSPVVVEAKAEAALDAALRGAAERLQQEVASPEEIGWAVDRILRERAECERVEQAAAVMASRARKRRDGVRAMLWPAIVDYCANAKRTSAKGWRLPGTLARLQLTKTKGGFEVKDKEKVLAYIDEKIGLDRAIDEEVIRVRKEVSEAKLRDVVQALNLDPAKVPGASFTPPGDELGIRKS